MIQLHRSVLNNLEKMRFIRSKWFALCTVFVGVLLLLLGFVFFASKKTSVVVTALQKNEIATAVAHAQRAQNVITPLSFLTFGKIPILRAWQLTLEIPQQAQNLVDTTYQLAPTANTEQKTLTTLIFPVETLKNTLTELSELLNHIPLPQKYAAKVTLLHSLTDILETVYTTVQKLSTGTTTWVVLLQNTDELRATGGFAGSYALITIKDGTIEPPVIEDIYDADGQFTGYVAAPAGIREYTSSNNGLRLPDANWYPEFAQSAQTMLQFFALGNKRSLSGMGAINLNVIEDLLRVTGPLYIPDYNATVNADTLHQVLREERDNFFAGSIQKKHLLSLTFSILQEKIATLGADQKRMLVAALIERIKTKDIQLYAIDSQLQNTLTQNGLSPALIPGKFTNYLTTQENTCKAVQCPQLLLSLIESNVGINKVNRSIERTVTLTQKSDQELSVKVEFHNTALANDSTLLSKKTELPQPFRILTAQNGYANYQRIITSPDLEVSHIQVANAPITPTAEQYTTPAGVRVDSAGFLLTVLPESKTTLEFTLKLHKSAGALSDYSLFIFKQSGLTPPLYSVTTPSQQLQFSLSGDTVLSLK